MNLVFFRCDRIGMMKKLIMAYAQLSKTERIGFITLSTVLLLLICCRATLHLWIKPGMNPEKETRLIRAWEDFKTAGRQKQINTASAPATLFTFDPNTLDSTGFRKLGLQEKTTRMLLNWRKKGKVFYKKEDLKSLHTLAETTYYRLDPYIRITGNHTINKEQRHFITELNTADSASLVRLRGIGPALARKITERRKALGGFVQHEQLLEIYPFKDTVITTLRRQLTINPDKIKQININTADIEILNAHPYINKQTATGIIMLREELGNYKNITELKRIPLMNEENYRKIAPYLTVE